jgi:hypothetical protein
MTRNLKLNKREDGYWITGDTEWVECGPYKTRAEADDDRCGLERTLKNWDDPEFWRSTKAL